MDGNFLVAVAIFILILVILYGSGCTGGHPAHRKMTIQRTLEAPDAAAMAGADTTTPVVTTVAPAGEGTSVVSYEFDAPRKVDGVPAVESAAEAGSPPLSERFNPMGMLRAALKVDGNKVTPVPSASASVIQTERDLVGLFKNRAERMCGERLTISPETEAKFAAEKLPANLFPPGASRRRRSKHHKKERFVDANGRWQSFMYYHVGNDGDPRPLGDYVDPAEIPHVEPGEEVVLRKSREQFTVPPLVANFAATTAASMQQALSDVTGIPTGPSPAFVVSKRERLSGNTSDVKGPRTIRTPDGRCLGVVGGRDGTKLGVMPCQPTARDNMQSWEFGANSQNGYQIRASVHRGDSYCLTSLPDGELQLMPCLDVPQQGWSLPNKFSTGEKQIKDYKGQCMTIIDGAMGVTPKVGACTGPQANWSY